MPRKYIKKLGPTRKFLYDPVYMERAVAAVANGRMSIRTASEIGVLPKTVFPALVKEAIEEVGLQSALNTKAGFKACGIVPFNPDHTLKKIEHLKNREDNNEENEEARVQQRWANTIVDHLRELRTVSGENPKRGKRVNVIAGKSVCTKDLQEEKESSEEEEDGIDASLSDVQDDDVSEDLLPVSIDEHFQLGDFVIVKFVTNKRDRFFAAKIEEILGEEAAVKCLRKKSSKKEITFAYPEIDDIVVVKQEQIIKKIYAIPLRRGTFTFKTISNYNLE
ncbi:hypothetical protein RN001_014051 [Aquatica leii]|uniref:Uncharacterized protein n=1 Tax=Aquatica leii TaxID=1421715 RepID=A0AAN7P3P1_9COLE|nr:hypothetical protein RN001_014051 [Aquatica leii]